MHDNVIAKCNFCVQWNLSTNGAEESVIVSEVSSACMCSEGYCSCPVCVHRGFCTSVLFSSEVEMHARVVLGREKVSCLERCLQFRGVLIERFYIYSKYFEAPNIPPPSSPSSPSPPLPLLPSRYGLHVSLLERLFDHEAYSSGIGRLCKTLLTENHRSHEHVSPPQTSHISHTHTHTHTHTVHAHTHTHTPVVTHTP